MRLTLLQTCLWLAPTVLEGIVVLAMFYRKLWRDLPIFLSYLVFEVGRTCLLFSERNNARAYFYSYWITEALGCMAAMCVIKELFNNAFARHLGLRQLGNVLFQWSIAILLITAVLIAWLSPGADAQKLMAGIYVVKRTAAFVEAGLLGFLCIFAVTFGIGWQHYATGICVGLGLYGAVELSAITARAIYGPAAINIVNWLIMTANNCCVLVWAFYFLSPVREQRLQHVVVDESKLEEWNEALLHVLKR